MALDAIAKILQAGAFTRQQAEALLKFHDNITLTAQQIIDALGYTPASAAIMLTAGAGLIGGGDLSANRSFAIDPAVLTAIGNALPLSSGTATSNTVTGAGHTHQIISTAVGAAFLNLTNPSAIRFPRINADNSVSALDAASFRTAIGAAASTDLSSYVLKAGDTMTGALTNTAAIALDYQRTNGRMFIRDNGSGFPTIDFVNPANSAFAVGRFTGTGFSFNGGPVDANAGLRAYNAGQVKVYDSNNDVPVELGLGYGSGTDRNGYLWNRNNGHLSFGTNNTERVRIQAGGSVDVTGGQLAVVNNNLVVSGGDIFSYRAGGTTGVIFLRQDSTRYLYYDGGSYFMPGAPLYVGGTINSDTRAITGLSSNVGFQIVWNTVQAGQGRTEFVNNNAGSSGGFTFYDRASIIAGTGSALAAILPGGIVLAQGASVTPASWGSFAFRATGSYGGGIALVDGNLVGGTWMSTGPSRMIWGMNDGAGGAGMTGLMTLQPANPTLLLQVEGGVYSTGASATINWRNRSGTEAWALYCASNITRLWNGSTDIATFTSAGVATAANWVATSDARKKTEITEAQPIEQLAELTLHDYTWIHSGKRGRGPIAQHVRGIAPAYVHEAEDGTLSIDKGGLALEVAMLALRLAQRR